VCDLETSRIGAPYIYNVRLLRVKKSRNNMYRTEVRNKSEKLNDRPDILSVH
jgi:hypothetical protein